MSLDLLFNNPIGQIDELALEAKKLTKKIDMEIIEIQGRYYRVNENENTHYQVYWNETFEEWTPVLWEQQMEI